jgi:hypothetical protein
MVDHEVKPSARWHVVAEQSRRVGLWHTRLIERGRERVADGRPALDRRTCRDLGVCQVDERAWRYMNVSGGQVGVLVQPTTRNPWSSYRGTVRGFGVSRYAG